MGGKFLWVKRLLFVLVGIPFLLVGPFLVDSGYQHYYGDEVYLITGNATGIPLVLCLMLLGVSGWLFGLFKVEVLFGGRYVKAVLSRKKRGIVAGISICVALVGIVGSMFWFEKFTMDGVECVRFASKREYGWQDADHFSLKADFHGVLVVEVTMKDGRHLSFNGGILRLAEYDSDAFIEQFPEGAYDYILWLAQTLEEGQVPLYVDDKDGLLEELDYVYWRDVAEKVFEIYQVET